MEFQINQVFTKEEGYPPEAAVWCNERGDCYIEEFEGGYRIVKIPDPTSEELAEDFRRERNQKIKEVAWMTERHRNEKDLGIPTTLTEEQYRELLQYIQDLREVPQQGTFPKSVTFPELPGFLKESTVKPLSLPTVGI